MRRKKIIWLLFPSHIIILLCALVALVWFGSQSLRDFYIDQMVSNLKSRTRLIEPLVENLISTENFIGLNRVCLETGVKSSTRITVIDPAGDIICDSESDPTRMENHSNRPEIIDAVSKGFGSAIRYSATTRTDMIYVAVPLNNAEKTGSVLRTSIPVFAIDDKLNEIYWQIILAALVVTFLAGIITLIVSRKLTRPLVEMTRGVERFAAGEFSRKLTVSGSEEVAVLAHSMNKMADQMNDRIHAVVEQRNKLETVFSSMVEGVITVDKDEQVINLNEAAANMLDINLTNAGGRNIPEVVRNIDLIRFIQQTLASSTPVEQPITFNRGRDDERVLQVHGVRLLEESDRHAGALIVINDVTRLLRLENVRRDFVANVSHELKTPITSIKGYVETLLDDNLENKQHVRDFLEIVQRQTNRLYAIVEDLLTLSRIEREYESEQIELTELNIKDVLVPAIEACSSKASEKNVAIRIQCPDDLVVTINGPLLEQAVINLIDNAVKYSDAESSVTVQAESADGALQISITDTGTGIAEEHLPRLFERFYLVDKARSRKLGGTGLGLAIVKHIAMAHNGQVDVVSRQGKGSTFTIKLPEFN